MALILVLSSRNCVFLLWLFAALFIYELGLDCVVSFGKIVKRRVHDWRMMMHPVWGATRRVSLPVRDKTLGLL